MRLKSVSIWVCIMIALGIILLPFLCQFSYRERLISSVGIGSSKDEYLTALRSGRLGQGFPRPGYTFWRPVQFHGIVYTIWAYPMWDTNGHLSGYEMDPVISLRGRVYEFGHPPNPWE